MTSVFFGKKIIKQILIGFRFKFIGMQGPPGLKGMKGEQGLIGLEGPVGLQGTFSN